MRQTARSRAIIALAILPIFLFYAILIRKSTNLPYQDDYDALLGFANHIVLLQSLPSKLLFFLSSQHHEYKLFLDHALVWLQLGLLGHVDLRTLCILGDATILPLAAVVWKMFRPADIASTTRLALFIPISFLLFQLQYQETLNWAMAGLQNLPVLLFSLLTIYLLVRPDRSSFAQAAGCTVLAVASSGNGLLLIPIGVLMLVLSRRYAHAILWIVISAVCLGAYFYHYDPLLSQSPAHRSILRTMLDLRPLYVLAFLGAVSRQVWQKLAIILGASLCLFFLYLLRRGYLRRNPAVIYSALFLILTAVGVAGIRSDFGIIQSLSSRYNMYSALLLVLAWIAFIEEFPQYFHLPLRRNRVFLAALSLAILFTVVEDGYGFYNLSKRDQVLVHGMTVYEHPDPAGQQQGPILPLPLQDSTVDQLDVRARSILTQSISLRTYTPPTY